jgi:hypothetical protein
VILEHLAAFFAGTEIHWWDVVDVLIVASSSCGGPTRSRSPSAAS